ncbi:hypothetical protein ASC80_04530 [Afipia sp. Root123D2]|uniref:hypothetical protein n=1 Tax=Afipia sp. Root123D2 TaxID=1736436 RepID=UPI000701A6C7|nr:hypothetical protein [Afipia sp. Root123D2]KQW22631.1 hypothetical protein ASC80_04530 [Afipia sp. Root123D2]
MAAPQRALNNADVVGEVYTEARIEALNTALAERGISGEQVIAILPEAGQTMVKPTPPRFRVLYRTA